MLDKCGDRDQEEQLGNGLEDFDQAHAQQVKRAGIVPHQSADEDADDHGDGRRKKPDRQGDPRGMQKIAQDVGAVGVRAEPMRPIGLGKAGVGLVAQAVVGRIRDEDENRPLDGMIGQSIAVFFIDRIFRRRDEQGR